ncbi:MAG: hypothetical protein AUI10_13015 [Actinobacteria bacterium 13_2_20CM_2_72_6]|nr:MAG: hypothetical protein AUI10_13015 [Actinobacteria bacterium 13_2_20CM_2_72_6]OLE29003.1 MAG: hypothetical protein AUG44_05770 [Actinobacteria bacterium 13_1_20CM_3_71_11]
MTDTWEAGERSRRPAVDAGRLWAGGLATALVAALVSVAGILLARSVFDVAILAPKGAGVWGDASTGWYAFGAAVVSLVATGLMHVLALFTPRPMRFFGWVVALATIVAVLAPFVAGGITSARVATAILNLVLGVAIGSLVAGTARSAIHAAGSPGTGPDPVQPGW